MTEVSLDPRVCESWQTIRPSRKDDKLSRDTAQQIASNNVARDVWCVPGKSETAPKKG